MKIVRSCCVAVVMLLSSAGAMAQTEGPYDYDATPSSGAMAFDLILVRPLGLVGTVAGVGLFVLDLPFSILRGSPPRKSAQRFIVEPAQFTFTRELGRMESPD